MLCYMYKAKTSQNLYSNANSCDKYKTLEKRAYRLLTWWAVKME